MTSSSLPMALNKKTQINKIKIMNPKDTILRVQCYASDTIKSLCQKIESM